MVAMGVVDMAVAMVEAMVAVAITAIGTTNSVTTIRSIKLPCAGISKPQANALKEIHARSLTDSTSFVVSKT
jgi:hypothetical protein